MLQNSFIQLPGVGVKKEELLWKKGVLNWDDFVLQSAYSKSQAKENKLLLNIEACIKSYLKSTLLTFIIFFPFQNHGDFTKNFETIAYI